MSAHNALTGSAHGGLAAIEDANCVDRTKRAQRAICDKRDKRAYCDKRANSDKHANCNNSADCDTQQSSITNRLMNTFFHLSYKSPI